MNVRDVLTQLGIPFREHGESSLVSEGWAGLVCPFPGCGQGAKFGCGVHLRTGAVSCWKCGRHRLGDTLAAASGRPLREILPLIGNVDAQPAGPDRPVGKYTPPEGVGPLLPVHRKYLTRRGLDPDQMAEMYNIGGIGQSKVLNWRIFIPVYVRGVPVTWTTRAVGGRVEPRYLSAKPDAESVPIKRTLFGMDRVRHAALVVEGPMDALRVGPGAVATYGLTVTPAQIALLSAVPVRILCFDNEPAAQRRAAALAAALAPFPGATHVARLATGKDAADADESEIRELRGLVT